MKAIDLLKLYREGLLYRNLKIELRINNYAQKTIIFYSIENLQNEPLLQLEIADWFIGSDVTDGNIVINLVDEVGDESNVKD